ncbi:FERM and PDZ domain-containing protein 2 [Engraulis encrasicolus]|uniref:FERM and PDZ domain-containing protein 2 n=1 Tax=Engraulis encrasicolus TaxID=184585 RepID=UPI002FD26951
MSSTFVTLKEVLEGRGAALEEGEVWGLLLGTAEALLDLSYKGQTNICNIIMPGSLLLSATGTLAFKSCSQSESSAPFAAPEMLQGRPVSSKLATEKVAVYSLGMTLYWCVDYRVPQNQPVQLSDALNVLLLSMCEDLAHRRVGLAAILEACEEQHKTMPNLSPTRTIRQLVEQWSNYTAESASSDPTVPLSGRSQMVRERLHAGLSQQKMRAPWGRTSSPPFSVQTLPNRIQRGLQHRASSSSSWSSRAPYASDSAIRPASPPISISESTTSLNTRKAKTLGPEFVRMGDEPQVTLELPGSIVSKKGRSSVSQREVCVYMPNDACLLVRCDIKSRGRDVFDMVVAHANLVEHFYFGLAFIDDDEFFFLEPELKISKVAPDIWKKQPGTPFTLYLRVKFFADNVSFIQHRLTRHQYYLQLRKDVLEDRLHCSEDTALYLAALALQAEFGDYMAEVYGRTYFQVEQYVPKSVCDRMSLPCLREELPRLHANYAHMLPDEAEMEFLKLTQQLSEYGVLFHRVGREREKRPVGGDMQLGISSRGVTVYELRTQTRYMCRHFPWSDTQSISTGRHKFSIECGPSGKKHVFQTESSRIAQYLLNLCSAQHKFHSEMTSRQLTHTLTSDDNLEKYLATCRRQHQMKRLSCSEMILSNVGVANALASDSISKSCDDLTAKADTHSRKLHDISETRESSQDISTPEPLHRIMSSVSLQKQDSETPSRSSSSRDTPTRTPPEREIICVTLKKDPKLGYGFVIVGEDNTGKLDLGIFIASIIPDGPADKDGRIRPGGRLISLNKTSLEGVSFNAAAAILQNSPEEVELIVSQPKQGLNDSKLSLEGGCVGMESGPGNEFRPGVEELEEALTTILTPKHTRRLHVPVVRILDTQDSWSRCSSVSNLHAPDVLSVELRKKNGSLGISVAGGVNTNMRNGGIYIKSLVVGGAADLDGRIQIGDRLLEVDGNNLRGVTHRQAVECLKRTGEVVSLLVERDQMVVMDTFTPERQLSPSLSNSPSSSPTHRRDVTMETTSMGRHKDYSFVSDENTVEVLLHRSVFGLGFSVCVSELCSSPTRTGGSVVRIRHLFPGQPAMESGLLLEGDVILAVNGQSLKGLAYQRVMQILRGSSDEVRLTVCRPPPGTLPEVDTSSLSATPLKETRSMSLDLRMRDLSMDFHRLLQMKAEETRQEKQLLLQSTSGSEPGDTPIKEAGRKHTCIRRVELNNALPVSRSSDMLNKGAGVGLNNDVTGSDLSKKVELKTVSGSKSSDTLNKGVELDDKPTKEEVPKDTSCVNKVELNNAAVRKAGSSDELTQKGEGSSEEAGSSLTASHPIAAAGAVAMATDSSSPSAVDAALGHLENITFPSGVCQQVNGSTISMMADGLAFLADEEYLTINTHTAAAAIAAAEPSPITLQPPDLGIRSLPKTNKKHTHTNRLSWVDEEEEEEDDPNREILKEFELSVTLVKSWSGSFGFTIARSRLDGCYYIQEVLDNPARSDGRLRAGDRLIIVNGHDVTAVTDDVAMGILRSSSRKLVMVLGRAVQNLVIAPPADSLPDIILHKTLSGQLGIKLTGGIGSRHQGIYVLEVVMNSPASEEGSLQPGDKILYISGRCTLGMTLEDAVKACENASRKVKLKALRDDQPLPSKAKWNGLFDWKKERRFFPRFDDYEDSPEEGHERCESSVRFRPHPSPPPPQEESCIIQVEFSKPESGGLGFALMGGANGSALRVKEICRGGVAHTDGRLRVGDILLEVNGVIVSGLSHSKVVEMLRQAEGVVQLTICRDFLSLTPPTERRPPPTEHQSTEVKDDEIVPEKDQPTVPLNNTRRTSVHSQSQESSSSTPPVSRCCPSLRADDLLPTRISTPPPHDPTGDQDTPPAWSSDEEDEDEDDTQALKLLPPTGRPIVSEDELSTLAIISPCKTGSYSGSRIKTLIQILEHQDQQEILKEFMDLQHMKSSDECVVGRAPENRLKNRYRDILPYDKTRVLLGEEQGYINASYIRMQVGDEELLYIASQAPMSSTVGSFWQMVWESRCDVVVMTTREEEAGRSKVYRYWPDSMDIPMETDRYQLTLDNHQTLRDFHINVVKMVDKKNGNCHFVKQVCVCRWPDHRPAGSSEQLVRLVSYMRAVHSRGPIIVHCSGGIGRTAVLICTDIIVRRIHRDLTVSVSDIVKEMRTQRHGMIQTKEQYLFCYKVWLEILQGILQLHGNQWQLAASV